MYAPPDAYRGYLALSKEEAQSLSSDSAFLSNVYSWFSLVDAVAAVIRRLGEGATLSETSQVHCRPPLVVCYAVHVALVTAVVLKHMKWVGECNEEQKGINADHRGKWMGLLF